MSQARFTESCVLTGFFKHFKGGNFVASQKTHWLTSVASTDDFTGSKRKKRALAETLVEAAEVTYYKLPRLDLCCLQIQLTLKAPNKIAADDILIFYFYLCKKIKLDFSYESSA